MACHNLMMPSSCNGEIPCDQKTVFENCSSSPAQFLQWPLTTFFSNFPLVLIGLTLSVDTFFFAYINTFSLAQDGLHAFLLGYYALVLS